MHHTHAYAVQTVAFYLALIPFAALVTMISGARMFDALQRARKPAPPRPAIVKLALRNAAQAPL